MNVTLSCSCQLVIFTSISSFTQPTSQGISCRFNVLAGSPGFPSCCRCSWSHLRGQSHVPSPCAQFPDIPQQSDWKHHVPMMAYILIYILCVVLCFAVGIMFAYHLWTIASGETSVESQDHDVYRRVAKSRDEVSCFW